MTGITKCISESLLTDRQERKAFHWIQTSAVLQCHGRWQKRQTGARVRQWSARPARSVAHGSLAARGSPCWRRTRTSRAVPQSSSSHGSPASMRCRFAPYSRTMPGLSGRHRHVEVADRSGNARSAARLSFRPYRGHARGEGLVGQGQRGASRLGRPVGIRRAGHDRPKPALPAEPGGLAHRCRRSALAQLASNPTSGQGDGKAAAPVRPRKVVEAPILARKRGV